MRLTAVSSEGGEGWLVKQFGVYGALKWCQHQLKRTETPVVTLERILNAMQELVAFGRTNLLAYYNAYLPSYCSRYSCGSQVLKT